MVGTSSTLMELVKALVQITPDRAVAEEPDQRLLAQGLLCGVESLENRGARIAGPTGVKKEDRRRGSMWEVQCLQKRTN